MDVIDVVSIRALIREAFPDVPVPQEVIDAYREPIGLDTGWFVEALLQTPWSQISLKTLESQRDCPIFLSNLQIAWVLPAYLDAIAKAIGDNDLEAFEGCLEFLYFGVNENEILPGILNGKQREAVVAVIKSASQFWGSNDWEEEQVRWEEGAFWWENWPLG